MRLNKAIDCTAGYSLISKVTNINPTDCFTTCKANSATMCEWSNHNVCWVQKCSSATYIQQTYWQSAIIPSACYEHPPIGTLDFACSYPNATASGTAADQEGSPLTVSVHDGAVGSGGAYIGGTTQANPNYSFPVTAFPDGLIHQLYAYAKDIPTNVWYQIAGPIAGSCAPTITLSATPNPVTQGNTSNVAWTSVNATSCTATNGSGTWPGAKAINGTFTTTPLIEPTLFSLTCTNDAGTNTTKDLTINVNSLPPTVAITNIDKGDYCSAGAQATVSWLYTSQGGVPWASWQMQVSSDAAFTSIVYQQNAMAQAPSDKTFASRVISKILALIPFTHAATPLTENHSAIIPAGTLSFGSTYWVRVKETDTYGSTSAWSPAYSFSTPSGAYPQVSFTVEPAEPIAKQPVTFTDTTDYAGALPLTRTWDFGDGTVMNEAPGTGTVEHIYSEEAVNITAKLTVTSTVTTPDSCSATQNISASKALPIYKEVLPGGSGTQGQ